MLLVKVDGTLLNVSFAVSRIERDVFRCEGTIDLPEEFDRQ